MLTIDDYLDLARKRQGLSSNRKLAFALDLNPSSLSQFHTRRAWPADHTMLKLADLAGLDRQQALIDLNFWRATSPEVREQYSALADLVSAARRGAAVVLVLLGALLPYPSETKAEQTAIEGRDRLYIMGNTRCRQNGHLALGLGHKPEFSTAAKRLRFGKPLATSDKHHRLELASCTSCGAICMRVSTLPRPAEGSKGPGCSRRNAWSLATR